MTTQYQPTKIEKKWQRFWREKQLFAAKDFDVQQKKFYHLVMFPYPSGDLHIGHWFNFAPADTYARFKYLQGYNILSPIGFDAFGLPAENAAIKRNLHPKKWTQANIEQMTKQLESMGPMYDWSRVISTADSRYYKWTQWMFLQMYKKGLAYKKLQPANWCQSCQTVLANEQVVNGECERCGSKIEIREIEQWLFKITKYADRLLNDLGKLDWPEKTKVIQRNWIGRSEGAEIEFRIKNQALGIKVFTTRLDTIFGATYLVLAPEHPYLQNQKIKNQKEVEGYIIQSRSKTELERKAGEKDKTGVFTGNYAINPATDQEIPIWVADYVLMDYGTGAIMAVPAHDQRDMEFAKKFDLPIVFVIASEAKQSSSEISKFEFQNPQQIQNSNDPIDQAYEGEGVLVNSEQFSGLQSQAVRNKITDWLELQGKARKTIQYRLRDWIVSRQRYWGVPIPILYCDRCGTVPVPEEDLPVKLPNIKTYLPKGKPPLATATKWVNTKCPTCGSSAKRETETMDTFVDSSWYFLRYPDPHNDQEFCDRKLIDYWCPVDIYIGGAEHTVLHLLYARFFTKVLYDLRYIGFNEPFPKLRHQGIILGPDRHKMSKSRGNVIDPDQLVEQFGSDVVRMYLMFMGPYDQGGPWNPEGIRGIRRFIDRVWQLAHSVNDSLSLVDTKEPSWQIIHRTIDRVTQDLEALRFNTAIAAIMELLNSIEKLGCTKKQFSMLVQLLSPFAPHLSEELWELVGNRPSIFQTSWPPIDSKYLQADMVTIAVSIDGKTRGTISVSKDATQAEAERLVQDSERLVGYIQNRKIRKIIYIPSKIINYVIE